MSDPIKVATVRRLKFTQATNGTWESRDNECGWRLIAIPTLDAWFYGSQHVNCSVPNPTTEQGLLFLMVALGIPM